MSDSNSSPPSEAPAASAPTGEAVEEQPAVLETPVEVVTTRIHYQAPPPPYSAVKNAPTEEANLLTNSITITIKCPSCLGFLADREMKTIVPMAMLVISVIEFILILIGIGGWAGYAKATSLAAIIFSIAASSLLLLKPISVTSLTIYGPFVTFAATSVLAAMQLCNVALSFYLVGVQYWSVFVFVVNGILSLIGTIVAGAYVTNMLLTSRQDSSRGAVLLPVKKEDADRRSIYWKEVMLLSFIGAVILLDEDAGQYVMFAFVMCIMLASTVFTFASSLLSGVDGICDVAHLELSVAASAIFVSLLSIVYSSFLIPAVRYDSAIHGVALRTEIIISVLLIVIALQIVVHILRRVSVAQYDEETSQGNRARNMSVGQGGKKPVHSPLV